MVFNDDPVWRRTFAKTAAANHMTVSPDSARWRSWGMEELLIKCVRKYMPWVRDIIIILSSESQKQPWMGDHGVRIVLHDEFIPAKFLPTFNSRTIEMYLHKIPNLSRFFLYGNDDMFPLSPLKQSDFFVKNLPCQYYWEAPYPTMPSQFEMACMNGLNFVAKDFGKVYKNTWLKNGHSIAAIDKNTCLHLWKEHAAEIEGSISKFRKVRNYNQYIYGWYQLFSGKYVERVARRKYAGVRIGLPRTLKLIKEPEPGIICVNDNDTLFTHRHFAKAVRNEITKKLNQ